MDAREPICSLCRIKPSARLGGKYKGRPKTIDNHEIRRILAEGNSISKTAKLLGVSMSSVQRAKREAL